MVATARCLATPSFKVSSLLRAILRDEIIAWYKRHECSVTVDSSSGSIQPTPGRIEGEALISRGNKAVSTIMNRIQTLATMDGVESKVCILGRALG